jgi:hypothetical protein
VGAQIIYKKMQEHFDTQLTQDKDIIEVRNNIFRLMGEVLSSVGSEPGKGILILDRLCAALAMIALKTCFGCWPDSISDIISYGSSNADKCFLALHLLENAVMLFEDLSFPAKLKYQI